MEIADPRDCCSIFCINNLHQKIYLHIQHAVKTTKTNIHVGIFNQIKINPAHSKNFKSYSSFFFISFFYETRIG